jgi:hypothetical protein
MLQNSVLKNMKFVKTGFFVADDRSSSSMTKAKQFCTTELVDSHIFLCRVKLILIVFIEMDIRTHGYEIRQKS